MAEEEIPEYFYRLVYLVVDLGTEGLYKVFEKHVPKEQNIESFLKSKKSYIEEKKKSFNDMQYGIITADPPKVSELDISLLFVLIKELTNVEKPNGGWKIDCPLPYDKSLGAYLVKLKSMRNEVIAHRSRGRLTKSEFDKHREEVENILLELAGYVSDEEKETVKRKLDEAKSKQGIDQRQVEKSLEKLLKWYIEDIDKNYQEMKMRLETVENKVSTQEKQQEESNSLKSSIREIQGQLQLVGLEARSTSADHCGPLSSATDGMNRDLEQIDSFLHKYMTAPGSIWVICHTAVSSVQLDQHPESPIDNPSALTEEDIKKYSKEVDPCGDWEIFGVLLGYKQTQMDDLKKAYSNQIQRGFYEMLKNWHNVVLRHNENPRELLAAAFIGIHYDETAKKILGPKLEGVKKLKPKPETEKEIQNKTFHAGKSEISVNIGGNNSINILPGSTVNFSGNNVFPRP